MVPPAILEMMYEIEVNERRAAAGRCALQGLASKEEEPFLRKLRRVFGGAVTRINRLRVQYARIAPLDYD
jgi:hypothetical protein